MSIPSFTWAGKPWVPIEWLAEIVEASAYRLRAMEASRRW
jgi:hypothetical protein